MKATAEKSGLNRLKDLFEKFCGLLLLLAVAVSMLEIFMRLFLGLSYDFVIDFTVWLTMWSLLLIAGPILPEGGHVSIDFLREKLAGRPRMVLELFLSLCVLIYGFFFAWGGILFVAQLFKRGSVFPRYIPIPMWLVELCVPVSMALFSLFALSGLIMVFRRRW
ncbi:MAG: TRAP transporter small permease [Thermodesulfobacteriota bacterium]